MGANLAGSFVDCGALFASGPCNSIIILNASIMCWCRHEDLRHHYPQQGEAGRADVLDGAQAQLFAVGYD